ncbi:MAG: oligosaccharide flippase family protein [Balneolaceae bacterium]|nr:oligosaccharide flippase family protein [Balneolaceae bacterium]
MGIIINQSIKNATISYIGIILGFIATIKLFPNILATDQFGLTRVLLSIMTLSVQFLNFGIPKSIVKFFPPLKAVSDKPQGLFWAFIIPPLLGFIAYSILLIVFDNRLLELYNNESKLLSQYFIYIIPLVFFSSSFGLLTAFLKASFNTVFASSLQEVFLRIITIGTLLLFSFDIINFDQFIFLFIANYALQYILLLAYSLIKGFVKFEIEFSVFSKKKVIEIFQYSFYAFFSGLTVLILGNIDLLMLGSYEGLTKTGIYAIAIYVGSVILVPKKSIGKISFPVISNSFSNNDIHNISDVYKKTSLNQYIAGVIIYIGVIANLNNLFAILPDEYSTGAVVIIIIGLGNLFDMATGANGQIIISSPFYKFDFYSSIFVIVVAIILNFLLIPIYGILGAAVATSISIIIGNITRVVYVWLKFRLQPFSIKILWITILGLLLLFISLQIEEHENYLIDIGIRSVSLLIVYVFAIWKFKISDDVNKLINSLVTHSRF